MDQLRHFKTKFNLTNFVLVIISVCLIAAVAGTYIYNSLGILASISNPAATATVQTGISDEYRFGLTQNLTTTLSSANTSSISNSVWKVGVRYCETGAGGFTVSYSSASTIVYSAVPGGGAPVIANTSPGACETHHWEYDQADNTWYLKSIDRNNPPSLASIGSCAAGTAAIGLGTTGPNCAVVGTVLKQNTQVGTPLGTVTNSTTPTTVFTYALPANTLGTTGVLNCDWWGDYTNGSGGDSTFLAQVTFGARTLVAIPTGPTTATATIGSWHIHADIFNKTTAVQNTAWVSSDFCNTPGVSNTLIGTACPSQNYSSIYSVAAQDTTVNQNITLVLTESVANAGITANLWGGSCKLTLTN